MPAPSDKLMRNEATYRISIINYILIAIIISTVINFIWFQYLGYNQRPSESLLEHSGDIPGNGGQLQRSREHRTDGCINVKALTAKAMG